ncbi:NUDIX hydrolase [Kribbella sp. NPDC026596]|uniref:NUDIX hydrolase n=1 Tax=Kribbella sp. NPDC026596 TaxID=3155122 RepID=UPI0033D85829
MTAESESTVWTIHDERLIDDTRRLRLSIASVELPDGVHFEQYVLRMPRAAMMVVLNDARDHVLMMWRHRFIVDRWLWELPGGYVDPDEDPAVTAAREVEEETGWRPRNGKPLVACQPSVGTTDAENLLFISHGADHIGDPQTSTRPPASPGSHWIPSTPESKPAKSSELRPSSASCTY